MARKIVGSDLIHHRGTDIRDQADSDVLTDRGQVSGLQCGGEVRIDLALLHVNPACKETVLRGDLVIEASDVLVVVDGLTGNRAESSCSRVLMRVIIQNRKRLWRQSIRRDRVVLELDALCAPCAGRV